MVGEHTARSRYAAHEEQMRRLDAEIRNLRQRVRAGGEGWRADLEQLAERGERRRVLGYQVQALRWVLGLDAGREPISA